MTSEASKRSILDYWPMKEHAPRVTQVKVLEWIEKLPPNIKYILCEVPVGGGKSPLALNLSGWLANSAGSSTILTPQKILQRQYEDSFDSHLIGSMYGKANYTCEQKKTNCDIGDVIKPKCEACPHKMAFNAAKVKPNVVLNYTIALLFSMLKIEFISSRRLMVFDECHTLEHHLTEFLAVTVSERACRKYGVQWKKPNTLIEAKKFLEERYLPAMSVEITRNGKLVNEIHARADAGERISKADVELIKEHETQVEQYTRLTNLVMMPLSELQDEYVFVPDRTFFRFKELYGARIFKSLLDPLADRFLFMSSTILDKDEFCKDLGIDPAQAAFISMDSEFPVEHRPVMFMPTMKMTYGWDGPDKVAERKVMVETIISLCKDQHHDECGVIHTGSFQVAKWLVGELQGKIPQHVMHHNPESNFSRDDVIKDFTNGDGRLKLLISPSVTEGLDLKGDLARFNIIAKTPYPFLGDAWVKARQSASQSWYLRQAMIAIIQGCGRVVRSKDDWGHTYILDSSFFALYNRIKFKVPKWWRNGYHDA
jgi:ATP-dependent DNA helicase DinG